MNSLDVIKLDAIDLINEQHSDMLSELTGNSSAAERDTWTVKAAAAQAVLDGTPSTAQQAMITTEAGLTGEVEAELAANIISNADSFHTLVGLGSGLRRKGVSAIKACATPEQVRDALDALSDEADATLSAILGAG